MASTVQGQSRTPYPIAQKPSAKVVPWLLGQAPPLQHRPTADAALDKPAPPGVCSSSEIDCEAQVLTLSSPSPESQPQQDLTFDPVQHKLAPQGLAYSPESHPSPSTWSRQALTANSLPHQLAPHDPCPSPPRECEAHTMTLSSPRPDRTVTLSTWSRQEQTACTVAHNSPVSADLCPRHEKDLVPSEPSPESWPHQELAGDAVPPKMEPPCLPLSPKKDCEVQPNTSSPDRRVKSSNRSRQEQIADTVPQTLPAPPHLGPSPEKDLALSSASPEPWPPQDLTADAVPHKLAPPNLRPGPEKDSEDQAMTPASPSPERWPEKEILTDALPHKLAPLAIYSTPKRTKRKP